MAGIKVAVGEEYFEELRKNGCYYVDKTEMIYQIAAGGGARVTLFTRPRRFGKTLTMTMLRSFFDLARKSKDVFNGLAVSEHKDFCREWQNQYPVLFISFKDVEGLDFEEAYEMLGSRIADLCKNVDYLETSDKVKAADKEVFKKLIYEEADGAKLKNSLLLLTRMMHDHYQKQVILLIDEYDVPLAKAHEADRESSGYYKKMLGVIRGLLGSVLKTNPFLKLAVLTGCLRISKESVFTGVNNFKTYSILDHKFSDAFGFTESEVIQLLEAAGLSARLDLVKSWYDGYIFGKTAIFCPWDVINFVSDCGDDSDMEPGNYWQDTSGNDIISNFVDNKKFDVSKKFETLLNGGAIEQDVTDQLTYENLADKEENLWSVLFMAGYLTKADKAEKRSRMHLRIPNAEIGGIFEASVASHFQKSINGNIQKELMDAFWNQQADKASKLISDLLWDTISYHDYHENYYHAFMTGMFVGCGYAVESNQENGLGRTDLVVTDRKNRRAIIIEAKKANREEDLESACLEGKKQIIKQQYIRGLKGYTQIFCYGIGFFQKTAMVRELRF